MLFKDLPVGARFKFDFNANADPNWFPDEKIVVSTKLSPKTPEEYTCDHCGKYVIFNATFGSGLVHICDDTSVEVLE